MPKKQGFDIHYTRIDAKCQAFYEKITFFRKSPLSILQIQHIDEILGVLCKTTDVSGRATARHKMKVQLYHFAKLLCFVFV